MFCRPLSGTARALMRKRRLGGLRSVTSCVTFALVVSRGAFGAPSHRREVVALARGLAAEPSDAAADREQ